jgi:ComF family protein
MFVQALLDVLFPPRCAACRELLPASDRPSREGGLCEVCETTLEPILSACFRCGLPGPSAKSCDACRRDEPAFDSAHAAFLYGAAIAHVLHRFKYEDKAALARPLGEHIARLPLPEADVVMPVPLHPSRRRERTYDQALFLAQRVAAKRQLACESLLLARVKATSRQVGQHRAERQRNMDGAFDVKGSVAGARVLLIDDVVTTGATASSCAATLKKAGARSVHVASVARAV